MGKTKVSKNQQCVCAPGPGLFGGVQAFLGCCIDAPKFFTCGEKKTEKACFATAGKIPVSTRAHLLAAKRALASPWMGAVYT